MRDLLWVIAWISCVMWLLDFALHFTLGGFIHLLLVLAIASVLVRVVMGHRLIEEGLW